MPQLDDLAMVASLRGEPQHISAAGVTRTGQRLATIENTSAFSPSARGRRRIVVVADNDRAARATLAAIRWFKTERTRTPARSVGPQRRSAFACERRHTSSTARIPTVEGILRFARTAREPLSVAMGGLSGARSSAADPGWRRAFPKYSARRLARGGDGRRI